MGFPEVKWELRTYPRHKKGPPLSVSHMIEFDSYSLDPSHTIGLRSWDNWVHLCAWTMDTDEGDLVLAQSTTYKDGFIL